MLPRRRNSVRLRGRWPRRPHRPGGSCAVRWRHACCDQRQVNGYACRGVVGALLHEIPIRVIGSDDLHHQVRTQPEPVLTALIRAIAEQQHVGFAEHISRRRQLPAPRCAPAPGRAVRCRCGCAGPSTDRPRTGTPAGSADRLSARRGAGARRCRRGEKRNSSLTYSVESSPNDGSQGAAGRLRTASRLSACMASSPIAMA